MGRARGGLILLCAVLAAMLLCTDYAQAARVNKSIGYDSIRVGLGKLCHGNQGRMCKRVPANSYTRGCHGNARCRGGKKEDEEGSGKKAKKEDGDMKPGFVTEEKVAVQFAAASQAPAFLHFGRV